MFIQGDVHAVEVCHVGHHYSIVVVSESVANGHQFAVGVIRHLPVHYRGIVKVGVQGSVSKKKLSYCETLVR